MKSGEGTPAHYIETLDEYVQKNMNKIVNTKKLNRSEKEKWLRKNFM